jgi:outer membrane protein OmpA-like peptidoglycan-associated protein
MHAPFALVAAMLLAAWPAAAQNPTTQQMIDQLRPRDGESGTRGVLRLPQQGAPRPPGATQPAAADARPQLELTVRFGFDSAELTPDARAVLDRLGQALSNPQLALYRFRLVGHTDARGTEAYNLALSQRRADAARTYLMQRWNIDAGRLVAEGMGFQQLADPANPEGPANRRVQVINEGPAS